jgi:hypothetical protein
MTSSASSMIRDRGRENRREEEDTESELSLSPTLLWRKALTAVSSSVTAVGDGGATGEASELSDSRRSRGEGEGWTGKLVQSESEAAAEMVSCGCVGEQGGVDVCSGEDGEGDSRCRLKPATGLPQSSSLSTVGVLRWRERMKSEEGEEREAESCRSRLPSCSAGDGSVGRGVGLSCPPAATEEK